MNPLTNLTSTKFEDLTAEELLQVYVNYCEENRYFDALTIEEYLKQNKREPFYFDKQDVLNLINDQIGFIYRVEEYFKYWCD